MSKHPLAPPALSSIKLLGQARKFQDNPVVLLEIMEAVGAPVVSFKVFGTQCYYIATPEGVDYVLRGNRKNYYKGGMILGTAAKIFGQGLTFSNGELWTKQRRLMNPMFHKKVIGTYFGHIHEKVLQVLEQWQAHCTQPQGSTWRNAHADNMASINKMVNRILFDTALPEAKQELVIHHMTHMMAETQRRSQNGVSLPHWMPTPANLKLKKSIDVFERTVMGVIDDRKGKEPSHNMIDLMLYSEDESTGERMDYHQIVDEVKAFYLAGTETAGNTVSWWMHYLSQHPEVAQKAREELSQVAGNGPLTLEHVNALPYLTQTLNETMRLQPPGWVSTRVGFDDDMVSGFLVKANSSLFLSPYMLHRQAEIWPNANAFDPERFADGGLDERQKRAFLPFGNGQRRCIGEGMAWLMMLTMCAEYLRHFKWTPDPSQEVIPEYASTIKPRNGYWVALEPLAQ